MKIKTLNCPNCNAKLELTKNELHGTCSYCNTPFVLDDEVIRIEHEIIDNTSLDIANTTLDKFKDYPKAELMYKSLMYKYAHKDDIYIGLIRSITHDFKYNITSIYRLNEINDYWQKYTSLTSKTNIIKYSESINEINKTFWLNSLKEQTNNFNALNLNINVYFVENAWNKYTLFSEKKEYLKLEPIYKEYLNKLINYQKKKKKNIKRTINLIIAIISIIILSFTLYTFFEKPIAKSKEIKTSSLYKYCGPDFNCEDKDFLKNYFYPTIADLIVKKATFNKDNDTIVVTINLKSKVKNLTKKYTFTIKDNTGPYIKDNNCTFTDTDEIDLTKCFTLNDYSDGIINSKEAKIDKLNSNFKEQGVKTIKVTAFDQDKNKTTKNIKVTITPTPINLNVSLGKTSIQINEKTTLKYEVTPDVKNKDVAINYNKEYIKIENNTITPLKIGESNICVTSKYDPNTQKCIKLDITPICKNNYTFNFDGSNKAKIVSGIDYCPGTYKIYAGVLNYNDVYFISHKLANGNHGKTITIHKTSPFNEEGTRHSLSKGSYIETAIGITSITITK